MMTYRCQVSDHEGVVREILKEAGDTPGLTRMLSDEGLYLISCKEENRQGRKKFSAKVIIDFTDTMALLLRSGLTVRGLPENRRIHIQGREGGPAHPIAHKRPEQGKLLSRGS